MKIFFLTAGLGTRLKPFTKTLAKPAFPFLNLPILAFPLYYVSKIKNTSLIFNLHHQPSSIKKALNYLKKNKKSFRKKKFSFSHEKKTLLGSGGGILKAQSFLIPSKHFLVINGDSLFFLFKKNIFQQMIKTHIQTQALATLLCTPFSNCIGLSKKKPFLERGIKVSRKTKDILSFKSQTPGKEKNFFHFTGIQIFSNRIFDLIPKGKSHIFNDVLSSILNSKDPKLKIKSFITKDMTWFEIGNLNSYKESLKTCLQHLMETHLKRPNVIQLKKELSAVLSDYNQENLGSLNQHDQEKHLKLFNLKHAIVKAPWIRPQS